MNAPGDMNEREPRVGQKLWHRAREFRGKVIASTDDDGNAPGVWVVRFWFRHKQRWHFEVVPKYLWGYDYCPISTERPEGHKERMEARRR